MSEPTRFADVTKEAICSALYGMEFTRFLGETKDPNTGWDVAWFRLSRDPSVEVSARQDPKQVMVAVRSDTPEVVAVQVAWLNFSGDQVIRGEQILRVVADPERQQATQFATEAAVLRVLEIYSDVLGETGVAGPLEKTAPESAAGDPDDPNDMAVKDE